eukprot:g2873.t1
MPPPAPASVMHASGSVDGGDTAEDLHGHDQICVGPKLAPFNPTGSEAIKIALDFFETCGVGSSNGGAAPSPELFMDLGCGDARVLSSFVRRFAHSVPLSLGIEYDPAIFSRARKRLADEKENGEQLFEILELPEAKTRMLAESWLGRATDDSGLRRTAEWAVQMCATNFVFAARNCHGAGLGFALLGDVCQFREVIADKGTVYFVYLVPDGMKMLRVELRKALERGAKIVSYVFKLAVGDDVEPTKVEKFKSVPIYCYDGAKIFAAQRT